jgi:hypothetical protein
MSSQPKGNDFNWGEVAPDGIDPAQKDYLARQVRLKLAAGKGSHEIGIWLRENGLSPDQADALIAEFAESGPSDWWQRFCGRISLVFIGVLSAAVLALVLVKQPWDGTRWTWTSGASRIDAVAGFVLFCFLYVAAMTVLWFLAMRFGGLLDHIRDKLRGKY